MDKARRLAQSLPQGDLSRYMAERTLMQAETEAGSNDFDECVDYANSAEIEVREHRHALRPGETFPGMPVPPQK